MKLLFRKKLSIDLVSSQRGFSLVEVLVSMAVTVIVMGAVFALLARGLRSTPVEMERSDLQAQARHALEQISRDVVHAGTGLPPELPAFTPPSINPELDSLDGSNRIEMVGYFDQSALGAAPVRVLTFDGQTVTIDPSDWHGPEAVPSHIKEGELVLIYDDKPKEGTWLFGLVSSVQGGTPPEITVKTAPGDQKGDITLPSFINNYNRPLPASGFITPVTVVSYHTDVREPSQPERVLLRQVNWGAPAEVALVEDLQIRYFISGTVSEPGVFPPDEGLPPIHLVGPTGDGQETPPLPQPDPTEPLQAVVGGVGISVTSRSKQANLEGSTVRPGESPDQDGFLRVTFASRVAPRNLLFRLSSREILGELE